MFEPEVFRKQMYSIEESTCDIFGTFRRPVIIWRPANYAPLLTPCTLANNLPVSDKNAMSVPPFQSWTEFFLTTEKN